MENFSHVVVEVPLARLLGHAFLNIYTPSLLLLLTAYTTLYFRMDIFEVRIMTALTALLVMATLFSQVSDSLPKTSNFKMIDVWLLFCIMSSFVIILFHALIDHVYTQGGLFTPELGNRAPQEVLKKLPRPTWSAETSTPAVAGDNIGSCVRSGDKEDSGARGGGVGVGKPGRKIRWTLGEMSNARVVSLARVVITGGLVLFNVLYWGLIYALRVPMD
ncbi:uncharacterized protein LOC143038343 [Oratosquilla oratoria]|uniref:uncharacterized protein LOC143038343 n=1 Tax=Oratosquilla oratoria TaxID=337810 RepID=UPI003F76CA59